MFKDIENIIFDLDNTLYNFSELWLLANEEIFYFYNFDEFTTYEKFFDEYKRQNKILVDMAKRGELRLNVIRPLRIINTLKVFNKNVD